MSLPRVVCCVLGLIIALPALAADGRREPLTGMTFVAITKGCFKMGSPDDAFAADDPAVNRRVRETETPRHEVCLDDFELGSHEVRRSDWHRVMGGSPPAEGEGNLPIAGITRTEAEEFARRLGTKTGGKVRYRLPTEAEWEFACLAGTEPDPSRVPSYDDLNPLAWYSSPYEGHPSMRLTAVRPVGTRAPNPWGLHDMLGNVWEWVHDDYQVDAYKRHALYNPFIKDAGNRFVIRGGSIQTNRRMVRCKTRSWLGAGAPPRHVGFRLVRIKD